MDQQTKPTSQQLRKRLEKIFEMQQLVNDLKREGTIRKYVEDHKLHLIDSRLQIIDDLLDRGTLK